MRVRCRLPLAFALQSIARLTQLLTVGRSSLRSPAFHAAASAWPRLRYAAHRRGLTRLPPDTKAPCVICRMYLSMLDGHVHTV